MSITIRTMTDDDVDVVAPVIVRAFNTVNARYGYPSEFPEPQAAVLLSRYYLSQDPDGCLVALRDGAVCGSIFARRRGDTPPHAAGLYQSYSQKEGETQDASKDMIDYSG